MPKFNYSIGDGNDGVSRMYPNGSLDTPDIDAAYDAAVALYVKEYGAPDDISGDDSELAAVWYEIEGAPALNGGAALIIEVWLSENEDSE